MLTPYDATFGKCDHCGVVYYFCDMSFCNQHGYACSDCQVNDGCPTCAEMVELVQEGEEVGSCPDELDLAEFKREQSRDDVLTGERIKRYGCK